MAALQTFKIQGQTAANAVIATVTVERHPDGSFRFTSGGTVWVYNGQNQVVNRLLQAIFTGTGGLPAGTSLFGVGY